MVKWRPKGICTVCGGSYALRVDGGLWKHYWFADSHGNKEECLGWKIPPKGVK